MRSLFLITTAFILFSAPAMAACSPKTDICLGQPCENVGATSIDKDQQNLIACLKTPSGAFIWKAMSFDVTSLCLQGQTFKGYVNGSPVCQSAK